MKFSQIKSLIIPEGKVISFSINSIPVWSEIKLKGTTLITLDNKVLKDKNGLFLIIK